MDWAIWSWLVRTRLPIERLVRTLVIPLGHETDFEAFPHASV